MKPHTEDVESILHPPHLIETKDPQQHLIEQELNIHIKTFINRLTVKEIIAFSYTLKDVAALQDILQQHPSHIVRNLKFNPFTYLEWQSLLGSTYKEFGNIGHSVQGELRAYIWNLGIYDE